jgi:hypothetical protein
MSGPGLPSAGPETSLQHLGEVAGRLAQEIGGPLTAIEMALCLSASSVEEASLRG